MTTIPEDREPLIRLLTVQVGLDRELASALLDAARDTERRILRERKGIRLSQLTILLRDLRGIQSRLWVGEIAEIIASRMRTVENAASRAARSLDEFLENAVGRRRAQILVEAFSARVQQGLRVDASRVPQQLSTAVYRNAALSSGKIETIIRSNLIRGNGAREMAEQVRPLIDPRVRGGVSHAATRLGRTELANAFHDRQIVEADREWVRGVRWNLSRSHPRKDECDRLASHDAGLGAGVWDKRAVPRKPHPQCMCYMTYDVMTPDEALELIIARAV